MKTTFRTFLIVFQSVCLLLFATLLLAAADAAPSDPTAATSTNWLQLLIPLLTPILIAAVKFIVPKIPKTLIPILAPILGAALDIVLHFAGAGTGGPLIGAILGSAGVGLREIVDQLKKVGA